MHLPLAVEVKELTKIFPSKDGPVTAVDEISFEVRSGEIFGILGPNGAGKTTTLEIIEGLQQPTSGSVKVLDAESTSKAKTHKSRLGVQLQEQSSYFRFLRLAEIVDLFASFYGVEVDSSTLLSRVGLLEKRNAQVKELSGGQSRRFSIAMSILQQPQIVFLDEPTSGLDPQARRSLWDLVREIHRQGTTVVITTHYIEEAEVLCDRVAILDFGKIKAIDSPIKLVQSLDSAYHIRFTAFDAINEELLTGLSGAVRLTTSPSVQEGDGATQYDLEIHDPASVVLQLASALESARVRITDLRIVPSTLEDVFIELTGRELRE
ncbi:MAG: ABC transporter ATP-binding protein [Acidimicrobiia bacterium]